MRTILLYTLTTVLLLATSVRNAGSQEFKCISTKNGLSSDHVTSVAQDSIGLIWIGTNKGLNSYNAYDVKTYLHDPNDSTTIVNNEVNKVFVTKNNDIVIGTLKGISVYNKESDNFKSYYITKPDNASQMVNYINDILQDHYGNIWVATAEGLFKFDIESGTFSPHFNYSIMFFISNDEHDKLMKVGIPDEVIQKLLTIQNTFFHDKSDLSNKILTILGEIDYKKYHQSILDIAPPSKEPFNASSVSAITLDKQGRIWLGLSNGHVVQTNIENKDHKIVFIEEGSDLESNIYSLFIEDGMLWFATIANAKIFDINKWELIRDNKINPGHILKERNVTFKNTNSADLWIGTSHGLYLYNKQTNKAESFKSSFYNPKSISSDLISNIFIDKQNNIWVGTRDGGLNKLKSFKQFEIYTRQTIGKENITDNKYTDIYVDNNQNIWAGHYSGGIDIFNSQAEIIESFHSEDNVSGELGKGTIMSIEPDKDGIIWVGSYLGGLQKYRPENKSFINFDLSTSLPTEAHTFQVLCDSLNNLWICALGDGLYKLSSDRKQLQHFTTEDTTFNPTLQNNWITFLYLAKTQNIMFYSGEKLFEIDEKDKSVNRIFTNEFNFKYKVTTLFEDSKDNFYIGTAAGLFLVKVNGKQTSAFKTKPILEKHTIVAILEDDHGNLWASTDNGLFRIKLDPENFLQTGEIEIKEYLIGDGLISNNYVQKSKFKTPDGKMFFGTDKGFVGFYPDSIQQNDAIPNIILTDFKLYNNIITPGPHSYLKKHISQTKQITLPHNQNFVSFSFAAINYINSEANQYAYKMEGVDDEWIYIGSKREANYTKLNHGSYIFRVKASNNDGIWNEDGVSVELIITPPFWKTSFALFLYGLFFIGLLLLFTLLVRYQEKYKTKMQFERLHVEKDNELNKMKLQFFTNISHEFRTPLTLIIGPLESLIQEGIGNSKQLQLIQRNTKKLLNLIDQIMDIRKLSSGKMKLKREGLEIVQFIHDIVLNFEYQCQNKQIELKYNKSIEKLETYLDSNKFETIISNLLSNAVKHTPQGGKISVSIKNNIGTINLPTQVHNVFSVSVEDTGPGIPEAEIDNVFERFYQSSNKNDGGSGVGLTLVKELTEMHGGKVLLKSKPGKGSEFTVYFPLIKSEDEQFDVNNASFIIKEDNENNETDPKSIKQSNSDEDTYDDESTDKQFAELDTALPLILVVEDNDEVRNYIISELSNNYRIIDAVNGKEALSLAFEKYPDIIISDIMMPEMDGLELCKKLKSEEKTSHIPIILLTAYNNENTNIAGYETGAESFLAKPFSPKILKTRINNILQNRERIKEKFSNILYSVPSNKSISTIDEQFLYKAIKLVEENLVEEHFSIEYLCKEMGYSRTALYSKIKALTDQSISEFIKLIRLKKSIELFRDGQKSINEVAFLVGFKTHSHFSRCFNDEFDMSPKEYLEKINTENKA